MAVNNGFTKAYVLTMAAATGSATVALPEGYAKAYLQIATCASQTALDVYGSSDGGTTYYQIRNTPGITTITAAAPSFIVAATCMVNGSLTPIPAGFLNYKFLATDSNPAGALALSVLVNE